MFVFPFQSHVGPKQKVKHGMKEDYHSDELPCGLACSSREAPMAAAVEDEGVILPGVLISAQHTVLDSHDGACGRYLSAHVQLNVPGPHPRRIVAHAGSRNEVITG
jgi:hypothetical protein